MARPTSFMSGRSGPMACGRNCLRHPILSSTSPTTAVKSLSRRLANRASSSILAFLLLCSSYAETGKRSQGQAIYRQVQVIEATSGASAVTIRGFGMFSEFGGAVHGSTHTPASSLS